MMCLVRSSLSVLRTHTNVTTIKQRVLEIEPPIESVGSRHRHELLVDGLRFALTLSTSSSFEAFPLGKSPRYLPLQSGRPITTHARPAYLVKPGSQV